MSNEKLNVTQKELLIRIDERTKALSRKFDDFEKGQTSYVSKIEFEPIKKLVYGMVGLVLTAVVLALIGLVIIK